MCTEIYTRVKDGAQLVIQDQMKKDILSMRDLRDGLTDVLGLAKKLKTGRGERTALAGKSLAMIFEKSSTRTRVSFEVAMTQLGGHAIYLNAKDSQLGRGETIPDTARTLSRYVDGIMYRAYSSKSMRELAQSATVPVINALDDLEHPCQVTADLLTISEKKGHLKGLKISYVGDGNNVCNSLLLGSAMMGMDFVAACPPSCLPNALIAREAAEIARANGCSSAVIVDPVEGVQDADVVYTDTWVSMGQEADTEKRERLFQAYQVNASLMAKAKPDALFMHCLPAHRGHEVTNEVMDGPNSVVFDQAENRLHAQKAILLTLMGQ